MIHPDHVLALVKRADEGGRGNLNAFGKQTNAWLWSPRRGMLRHKGRGRCRAAKAGLEVRGTLTHHSAQHMSFEGKA